MTLSATLPFCAQFTKASGSQQVQAVGLTVTVDVFSIRLSDGVMTRLVNDGLATEVVATDSTGVYFYLYNAALDFQTYFYVARFHTADATVQQVDIASCWFDFPVSVAKDGSGKVSNVATVDTATATTTVNGLAANVITAASIAADAITAAKIANGAIDAATFAAGAITLTAGERDALAAAILDLVDGVESGKTLRQTMRLMAAALVGKRSNAGTVTEQYDAAGSPGTARIVGNLSSSGDGTPTLTP